MAEHGGQERISYVLAFLVMAVYGSYGILVRWTGLEGSEQVLVFWRTLLGLALFIVVAVLSGRLGELAVRRHWPLIIVGGVLFALMSYATSKAIYMLPVSAAIFIIYLAPVIIAIAAPLVLKEKLERLTVVALFIAVTGLVFVSWGQRGSPGEPFDWAGVGFAVLGAFCYAATVIILKKLREDVSALAICIYEDIVVLLCLLPFGGFRVPQMSGKGWASLLVMGVVQAGVLSLLYVFVAKHVKAQHLGIIAYVEPVSATFLAFAFLDETPVWQGFLGGFLIIIAGLLVIVPEFDVLNGGGPGLLGRWTGGRPDRVR